MNELGMIRVGDLENRSSDARIPALSWGFAAKHSVRQVTEIFRDIRVIQD
ncbi:hypothetical protein [Nocardia farcinica]